MVEGLKFLDALNRQLFVQSSFQDTKDAFVTALCDVKAQKLGCIGSLAKNRAGRQHHAMGQAGASQTQGIMSGGQADPEKHALAGA
jgi:hypothetical protein